MQLPKVQQQKIEQLLQRLGLNDTEIALYVAGRYLGPSTVIQLAEYCKIKRVTAHSNIDKLLKQGLFLDTRRGKKRLIYPASQESLETLLENKKFELEQIESQLASVSPLFSQIERLTQNFPNVRMFQGTEGLTTVMLEMARDKKDVYILSDSHSYNELIDQKTLHRSYKKRAEEAIKTRMIFPVGFTDFWHTKREEQYDIHIKTMPQDRLREGGVEIRGDKLALHNYKQGFVTTTILENPEIVNLIMMMYESMRREATDYQGSFVML